MSQVTWNDAYNFINPHINAAGVHVWPFDPSFPLTVQFWRYDRQSSIHLNQHDYFELILVDRGEVLFQVQDRVLALKQGEMLVMGSTLFHRLIYTGTPTTAPRLMFLPQLICPTGMQGVDVEYLMPFLLQDTNFPHVVGAETELPRQVRELMQKVHQEMSGQSVSAKLLAKTYLKLILALLVRHYADYQGTASVLKERRYSLERLRPVFDFIDANYGDQFEIDDVASLISMSGRNFTRLFKRVTGQTFVAYLNGFRIEKARELLASSDRSIAEVSQSVGFCNQSYFGLMFQRLAHMSARAYREQRERSGEAAVDSG